MQAVKSDDVIGRWLSLWRSFPDDDTTTRDSQPWKLTEQLVRTKAHATQHTRLLAVIPQRLNDVADQQRPPPRAAIVPGGAVQQIGAEQQDVASLALDDEGRRIGSPGGLLEPLAAVRARRDAGGAVGRSEGVEERQRGNRPDEAEIGFVAMDRLRAAAGARLTPFDLRQEERLLQDMIGGGQHPRLAANTLHRRIQIDQGVAPAMAAGHRPCVGWKFAGVKSGAKRLDPVRGNDPGQQQKPVRIKALSVLGVEPADLGASGKIAHRRDRPCR